MEIKPLKRYDQPGFPTREIVNEHPELLRRLPNRWRRSAVIGTAVVAACGLVAARWATVAGAADTPEAKPAPVFLHGEGQGAFGCVATNPPVFLSEDEARAVIIQEFQRAYIANKPRFEMMADARTLTDFPVPETSDMPPSTVRKLGTKKQDLVLDGWDAKSRIGFEYVSETDFKAWVKRDGWCSVSVFDLLDTAERLQASLAAEKPEGTIAVFYDPMISIGDAQRSEKDGDRNWNQAQEDAKLIARYELRQQVRDFIKWLKAEGVI